VSENAITLVELDVTPNVAAQRALAITDWLLAEGIVVRNPTPDDLWQPSALLPGPKAGGVAPDAWQFLDLANRGVDVIAKRDIHHPIENYEPPPCPVCRTPLDPDVHYSLVEDWMAGTEPGVTCQSCGQTNRIGDWVHQFTFYIGNLAVRFNNWTPLSEKFAADLGSHIGSRWRLVLEHS
jgi:hypothetical protein